MTEILATADFTAVLPDLAFLREGNPVTLRSYLVPLRFRRPNGEADIERMLLDPAYFPPSPFPHYDNFTLWAEVHAIDAADPVSSVGLCNWDTGKLVADCGIEDDGGRYQVVALERGATLQASRFVLRVGRFGGYDGFYIGRDPGGEPGADIFLGPGGLQDVDVPLLF